RVSVPEQTDITSIFGFPEKQIQSRPDTPPLIFGRRMWRLDFDNQKRWENHLMGWASADDPLSIVALEFPTAEAAAEYFKSHGWTFFVEEPKRTHRVMSLSQ
ncbi:unnamed protein product, partial [Schistocephalus solidus]|uniref:NADH dehydrogenase [ubiquinone] iron-sulfur protein 4, mitochondrial n=1 Tax=Schistocephalus solidus TaxID=70667 RepID=A0A183TU56_SCHSO